MELPTSGIKKLDLLFGGGIPYGTQLLLEVDTGTGPLLFIEKWLQEGLSRKNVCFLYSYDFSAEMVLQHFEKFGIIPSDFLKNGKIVDFWTKGEEYVRDFSQAMIKIGEPNNINRVMDVIHGVWNWYRNTSKEAATTEKLVRSATYSLSTIIMTFGFEKTYKLARDLNQVSKTENAITLDVLHFGMHSRKEISTLEFLYDGVIRLEIENSEGILKRYLRVHKFPIFDFETKRISYEFKKNEILME